MTDETKEITKFIWSLGNYNEVAAKSVSAAIELVAAAGVRVGQGVLDVATGTGNVAVAAARRGASVSACDLTPEMVEIARQRADAEGLTIEFAEGDAEELPYPDENFDHVLSTFGAMFAPRPHITAAEMFRVARRGGVVGMANWTPESLLGRQMQILVNYAPGEAPSPDPLEWGLPEHVTERLGGHASHIEMARLHVREEYPSWDAVRHHYEANLGPSVALKHVLDAERYEEMLGELRELYESENKATDGGITVDAEYLQVIARKQA